MLVEVPGWVLMALNTEIALILASPDDHNRKSAQQPNQGPRKHRHKNLYLNFGGQSFLKGDFRCQKLPQRNAISHLYSYVKWQNDFLNVLYFSLFNKWCWSNWTLIGQKSSFPYGASGKESTVNAGYARDMGSVPGSGISGWGNGSPLQYSCLENAMDRGALWVTTHGVAKSQTGLSDT